MPGPDTVVEESPVLVWLLVGLGFAISWLMYRGMRFVWLHTIGWVISKIANVGIPTGFFGHVHPLRWLNDVNNTVMNYLAEQALQAENGMGRAFNQAAFIQEWIAKEIVSLGEDLYGWADNFQNKYLGRFVKAALYATFPAALLYKIAYQAIAHELPKVRREIKVVERVTVERVLPAIPYVVGGAIPGIAEIPWLIKEVKTFNRRWESWLRRLKRVEGIFAVSVFAGVLAEVFGVTAKCVRSGGPIGKMMRGFCGLPGTLFKDIFALIADFFIFETLCDVIPVLAKITSDVATPMVEALTPIEAGLCDKSHTVAIPLPKLTLHLPAPVDSLLAGV
jgi:hypothetical protein